MIQCPTIICELMSVQKIIISLVAAGMDALGNYLGNHVEVLSQGAHSENGGFFF